MGKGGFKPRQWLTWTQKRSKPILTSLIPAAALPLDRRQSEFFRRCVRRLIRFGAWEQAWALLELSTETHRYNPAFHRACEQARRKLLKRLHPSPARRERFERHQPRLSLTAPFDQLSGDCGSAVILVDPRAIQHWGCVVFPGISRGRFRGRRMRRFCNAVVEERYLFRGLPLADDPQVKILRRRFVQGRSWQASGGVALMREIRQRTGEQGLNWEAFCNCQLRAWDELFERIRREGYRSQAELQAMGCAMGRFGLFNEVEVCVNSRGEALFLEGKHRLFIAQALQLAAIPVIVNVWSRGFLERLPGAYSPAAAQALLKGGVKPA
jgi:hypothetical protein